MKKGEGIPPCSNMLFLPFSQTLRRKEARAYSMTSSSQKPTESKYHLLCNSFSASIEMLRRSLASLLSGCLEASLARGSVADATRSLTTTAVALRVHIEEEVYNRCGLFFHDRSVRWCSTLIQHHLQHAGLTLSSLPVFLCQNFCYLFSFRGSKTRR